MCQEIPRHDPGTWRRVRARFTGWRRVGMPPQRQRLYTVLHFESGPTSDRQSAILAGEPSRGLYLMGQLMDDSFRQQIATFEHRLSHLLRDGFDLQRTLSVEPGAPELEAMRTWQRECAATISQLSAAASLRAVAGLQRSLPLEGRIRAAAQVPVRRGRHDCGGILGCSGRQRVAADIRQSGIPIRTRPARRFAFVHDPNCVPTRAGSWTGRRRSTGAPGTWLS